MTAIMSPTSEEARLLLDGDDEGGRRLEAWRGCKTIKCSRPRPPATLSGTQGEGIPQTPTAPKPQSAAHARNTVTATPTEAVLMRGNEPLALSETRNAGRGLKAHRGHGT